MGNVFRTHLCFKCGSGKKTRKMYVDHLDWIVARAVTLRHEGPSAKPSYEPTPFGECETGADNNGFLHAYFDHVMDEATDEVANNDHGTGFRRLVQSLQIILSLVPGVTMRVDQNRVLLSGVYGAA